MYLLSCMLPAEVDLCMSSIMHSVLYIIGDVCPSVSYADLISSKRPAEVLTDLSIDWSMMLRYSA